MPTKLIVFNFKHFQNFTLNEKAYPNGYAFYHLKDLIKEIISYLWPIEDR